jgi:hypothetical protein
MPLIGQIDTVSSPSKLVDKLENGQVHETIFKYGKEIISLL